MTYIYLIFSEVKNILKIFAKIFGLCLFAHYFYITLLIKRQAKAEKKGSKATWKQVLKGSHLLQTDWKQ